MQLRQLPILPTIVVLIAAGIMVWLGVWQLGRAEEKSALIAKYAGIESVGSPVAITSELEGAWQDDLLFRNVSLDCSSYRGIRSAAGTSATGAKGWAIIANCVAANLEPIEVKLGWSRNPNPPEWDGEMITGVVDQNGRIVADPPLAGLLPLAKPDPRDLPNNHLAYAGQWFFFALTALVIYFLAMRSKLAGRREGED